MFHNICVLLPQTKGLNFDGHIFVAFILNTCGAALQRVYEIFESLVMVNFGFQDILKFAVSSSSHKNMLAFLPMSCTIFRHSIPPSLLSRRKMSTRTHPKDQLCV